MAHRRRPNPDRRRPRPDRGALYHTLDLHGETAASARRRTEAWLRSQRDAGERCVRLITGRGRRSVGPPVLGSEVKRLLRDLTGELVDRVEEESGGGALRVLLRSPSSVAPGRPARGLTAASPELRREAEEALAELGVDPTPELLEAEIRRIRARRQGGV